MFSRDIQGSQFVPLYIHSISSVIYLFVGLVSHTYMVSLELRSFIHSFIHSFSFFCLFGVCQCFHFHSIILNLSISIYSKIINSHLSILFLSHFIQSALSARAWFIWNIHGKTFVHTIHSLIHPFIHSFNYFLIAHSTRIYILFGLSMKYNSIIPFIQFKFIHSTHSLNQSITPPIHLFTLQFFL